MTLGKKELMVAVIVGIAGLAAAVHFLIFQQKAQTYDQTSQEYRAAVETLTNAEFINDRSAFDEFKAQTTQYSALVTSVVAELNLETADDDTSPPVGAVDVWGARTIELLTQLNAQRQGRVTLTFLGQEGWNMPAELPTVGGTGALADRVSQLIRVYQQLQFTQGNLQAETQVRGQYNQRLAELGINPQETSKFYYQPYNMFFNNEEWITAVMSQARANTGQVVDLRPYFNVWGLNRFGPAVPALKKIWIYNLVAQQLQAQGADRAMLTSFGEALEIGIPLGPEGPLDSINKQLQALLDIIDIAGRSGVQEITQIKMLRPINIAKADLRVPGATPPPEESPVVQAGMMDPMMMGMDPMMMGMDPMMGMGMGAGMGMGMGAASLQPTPVPDTEAVGTGAGIELTLRADNASQTRFYYELSHVTRTYGIDDLYVYNTQQGLITTATVEVITSVNLGGGAPVADPGAEVF